MIIKHKYNGKEYTLSNENLKVGDKVYSISWGKSDIETNTYEHYRFDFTFCMSGWISDPHIIEDLHHDKKYKPYEIRTNNGYGPVEAYFKIINTVEL